MHVKHRSTIAKLALAGSLALALAACGSDAEEEAGAIAGEPVAEVPAPDGSAWTQTVTRTDDGGWLVGNPDAPIQLVEYGSLTCPGCAAFSAQSAEELHNEYVATGRVNFELRSFMIHGVADLVLTRMLECAPETAAVPLADQIWLRLANEGTSVFDTSLDGAALEQANALPPEQRLFALAEATGTVDWFAARGVSRDQAQACLSDTAAAEQLVEVTTASAEERQVSGTPTFFLNGGLLEMGNGPAWPQVEAALQRAGAR